MYMVKNIMSLYNCITKMSWLIQFSNFCEILHPFLSKYERHFQWVDFECHIVADPHVWYYLSVNEDVDNVSQTHTHYGSDMFGCRTYSDRWKQTFRKLSHAKHKNRNTSLVCMSRAVGVSCEEGKKSRFEVHLLLPGLQIFNACQHVEMSGRVLLDDIHHVVRPQTLFKLALGHHEPHDAAGTQFTHMISVKTRPEHRETAESQRARPGSYFTPKIKESMKEMYCARFLLLLSSFHFVFILVSFAVLL